MVVVLKHTKILSSADLWSAVCCIHHEHEGEAWVTAGGLSGDSGRAGLEVVRVEINDEGRTYA